MNLRIPTSAWLIALTVLLFVTACTAARFPATPSAPTSPDKTAVKTDLAELRKYITIPGTPSTVKWQIIRLGPQNNDSSVPGPSTYQLTAILSYSNTEIESIKAKLTPEGGEITLAADALQDWFPASVQTAFIKQSDGSYKLTSKHITAEPFYRSPYLQGSAAFIGSNEIWLMLIAD